MPKYRVDKPSITAARLKYNLSFDYVAKQCGFTYAQLHGIMYHKSSIVSEKTYLALSRFFKFDRVTGLVDCIPSIEEENELKKQVKELEVEVLAQKRYEKLVDEKLTIKDYIFAVIVACALLWGMVSVAQIIFEALK
jgi:hypothetical protein